LWHFRTIHITGEGGGEEKGKKDDQYVVGFSNATKDGVDRLFKLKKRKQPWSSGQY
jgi:hypothetical protein